VNNYKGEKKGEEKKKDPLSHEPARCAFSDSQNRKRKKSRDENQNLNTKNKKKPTINSV